MDSQSSRPADTFAWIFAGVHGFLWIDLGFGLAVFVPGFRRIFRTYRLRVPSLTEMVLHWSSFLLNYWYILIPILSLFLALDWRLMVFLRRQPATKTLSLLWAWSMVAIPLLMALVAVVGLIFPLTVETHLSK